MLAQLPMEILPFHPLKASLFHRVCVYGCRDCIEEGEESESFYAQARSRRKREEGRGGVRNRIETTLPPHPVHVRQSAPTTLQQWNTTSTMEFNRGSAIWPRVCHWPLEGFARSCPNRNEAQRAQAYAGHRNPNLCVLLLPLKRALYMTGAHLFTCFGFQSDEGVLQ